MLGPEALLNECYADNSWDRKAVWRNIEKIIPEAMALLNLHQGRASSHVDGIQAFLRGHGYGYHGEGDRTAVKVYCSVT